MSRLELFLGSPWTVGGVVLLPWLVLVLVLSQYHSTIRRDYFFLGMNRGCEYTVRQLRECSVAGYPIDSFNVRMQALEDTIRSRVDMRNVEIDGVPK